MPPGSYRSDLHYAGLGLPSEQGTLSHEVGATLRCHISRGVGWPARHTERPDDGRAVILMNAARKPGMESPYRANGDNRISGPASEPLTWLCSLTLEAL